MTTEELRVALAAIDNATAADMNILTSALNTRAKELSAERASSVAIGDHVRIVNIRPKRLAGMTGEVVEIDPRRKYGTIRTRSGAVHSGMPLACMEVIAS